MVVERHFSELGCAVKYLAYLPWFFAIDDWVMWDEESFSCSIFRYPTDVAFGFMVGYNSGILFQEIPISPQSVTQVAKTSGDNFSID